MPTCPICGSEAEALPKTGDAEGFDCPQHGQFKVSGTVLRSEPIADRQTWETALERAKQTTEPGGWPRITTHDF